VNWRRREKDRELEQQTGIRPANHSFVSRNHIERMEREILGRRWYKRPPK
jgi:hypothetical protein